MNEDLRCVCCTYVCMCEGRLYVCEESTQCVCCMCEGRLYVCVRVMCSGTATLHYTYVAYTECVYVCCKKVLEWGGSCVCLWTCVVCVQGWWHIAPKTESVCGDTRVGVEGADSKVC